MVLKERCIHCLRRFDKLTRDHILPKSYYANLTTAQTELWTAPACENCNNNLGRIEQDCLIPLMLSMSSRAYAGSPTSAIRQRVLRSFNANAASSEHDRKVRAGRAQKVLKSIFRSDGRIEGVFPGFGYHHEWKPEEQYCIPVPADGLNRLGQKIIRGIEYKIEKRYVDKSFELAVYFCHENKEVSGVSNLIRQNGQHHVIAPGFEFYRMAPFNKKFCLYEIRIWNKLVIYGSLMKKRWWQRIFELDFMQFNIFE